MLEKTVAILSNNLKRQKNYIIGLRDKFDQYVSNTEVTIKSILEHDKLRDEFVEDKVNKFLLKIDERTIEQNNKLIEDISSKKDSLFQELEKKVSNNTNKSLKETEKLAIDELKRLKAVSKNELESTEKHIKNVLKDNLDKYTDETTKKLYDTIKEKIANIPPAKDGEDGKDAEVDYKAIGEMITKEISSNKSVKDIDFLPNSNEMKITYTDGTSKKLPLPKNKVVYGGGGSRASSGGIDLSTIQEITDIELGDFMLINRSGTLFKLKVYSSSGGTAPVVGNALTIEDGSYLVTENGDYIQWEQ